MKEHTSSIATQITQEVPSSSDAYQAEAFRVRGRDVHRDLIDNFSWVEMLFHLFRPELAAADEVRTLEALAVALANPGPRDPSVYAAMNGAIGGTPASSCLAAALLAGGGRHQGAREVVDCISTWEACGGDIDKWRAAMVPRAAQGIWPACPYPAGFDPAHATTSAPNVILLQALGERLLVGDTPLSWLNANHAELSRVAGAGCTLALISAMTLISLGFSKSEAEMLYLLLRLPGAAAHALEQGAQRYNAFPFPAIKFVSE